MELEPNGRASKVFLDGLDITNTLRGIEVRSGVDCPTEVTLIPVRGAKVTLTALLPESQIHVALEDDE